jgi:hypothetical protein
MNPYQESDLAKILRRIFTSVSILWLIFFTMGIIVAGASWAITGTGKEPLIKGFSSEQLVQLRNILIGMGIVEILIGSWFKNRFLKPVQKGTSNNQTKTLSTVAKNYAQAHLVPASMALSVSFYALALGLMGADRNSILLLLIISFFGLWLFQPRMKALRALVTQMGQLS